jgi:hypothetical protein
VNDDEVFTLRNAIWRERLMHPNRYGYGTRVPFFRHWIEAAEWADNEARRIIVGRIIASQRRRRHA